MRTEPTARAGGTAAGRVSRRRARTRQPEVTSKSFVVNSSPPAAEVISAELDVADGHVAPPALVAQPAEHGQEVHLARGRVAVPEEGEDLVAAVVPAVDVPGVSAERDGGPELAERSHGAGPVHPEHDLVVVVDVPHVVRGVVRAAARHGDVVGTTEAVDLADRLVHDPLGIGVRLDAAGVRVVGVDRPVAGRLRGDALAARAGAPDVVVEDVAVGRLPVAPLVAGLPGLRHRGLRRYRRLAEEPERRQ